MAAIKWEAIGLDAVFGGFLPGFVGQVTVGAVGFGLLALPNYLWTGKTADERKG